MSKMELTQLLLQAQSEIEGAKDEITRYGNEADIKGLHASIDMGLLSLSQAIALLGEIEETTS